MNESLDNYLLIKNKVRLIPYKIAAQARLVALNEDSLEVSVGYSGEFPIESLDVIQAILAKKIKPVHLAEDVLSKAIEYCYQNSEKETQALINKVQKNTLSDEDGENSYDLINHTENSPVIGIVNAILTEAIQMGASDIHFEPQEGGLIVRYRVDGVLMKRHSPPKEIESQIIARVKVISQLDIAETRLPQDGRLKVKLNKRVVDFRVSSLPVAFGERLVLRVLDKSHLSLNLEALQMPKAILESFLNAMQIPEGMILVTGPTGSGKTTTLYSALNKLLKDPINIMTIEDPVEYRFSGMAQISVNPKIQLTFASGLKHILRQDPDVIMIGEIRDYETAEIAIQSSLTGHRVFSTLHTNDAPSAITRLVDMGVEPYLVCSSISAVLAQRLVRKICPSCKIPEQISEAMMKKLGLDQKITIYKGCGCEACFNTGYKGRMGVYELLILNTPIKKQILKQQDAESLKEEALKHGFIDLRNACLQLVLNGLTTVEEMLSIARSQI